MYTRTSYSLPMYSRRSFSGLGASISNGLLIKYGRRKRLVLFFFFYTLSKKKVKKRAWRLGFRELFVRLLVKLTPSN